MDWLSSDMYCWVVYTMVPNCTFVSAHTFHASHKALPCVNVITTITCTMLPRAQLK